MPCGSAKGVSSNSICISRMWVTPARATSAIFWAVHIPPPSAMRAVTQVMSIFRSGVYRSASVWWGKTDIGPRFVFHCTACHWLLFPQGHYQRFRLRFGVAGSRGLVLSIVSCDQPNRKYALENIFILDPNGPAFYVRSRHFCIVHISRPSEARLKAAD